MSSVSSVHPVSRDPAQVLKDVFGFDAFRRGQLAVVDALLAGRHVLTVMPTGAGKSLCYQVPAMVRDGLCLVVSPLVALMQDQVAALALLGVAAETVNSSRPRADNVAAWRRVRAGEVKFLYLSPERLMTEEMLTALAALDLNLIAVDEAHCISQWGPSFRPDYADLAALRRRFPTVPIAALTATADATTRADIVEKLFGGDGETFVQGFDRPNIALGVEPKARWRDQLLAFMNDHKGDSGIVYCLSRKKADETAALLRDHGHDALSYHAGMEQAARVASQNDFMTRPGVVIVATIAFGMGIDKADVRFVFHTDLPGSVEAYYQEIGRAGRDGAPAAAHMLYGLDDIRLRRQFIEDEDSDAGRKRREHKRLDALIAICESPECRRRALLAYFGETIGACGNCDICRNPLPMTDGSEAGQMILSAVYRTGQRFGAAHIIDVLRGADTEKIRQFRHHTLPTHGGGAARSKPEWQSLIRQLVAAGFLKLDIQGYGGLSITDKGGQLLRGDTDFFYRQDLIARPRGAAPTRRPATPAGAAVDAADFSAEQAATYARLKELRLELARARGVPAYVIFSDRSLIDMVVRCPRTTEDFAQVHGVGQAKLRDFAERFLSVLGSSSSGSG